MRKYSGAWLIFLTANSSYGIPCGAYPEFIFGIIHLSGKMTWKILHYRRLYMEGKRKSKTAIIMCMVIHETVLQKEESKFINGEASISFKNGAEIQTMPFEYFTDTLFEI